MPTSRTRYGIDHDSLLEGDEEMLRLMAGPRIKSPISNTFYPKWKLDVSLHPRVHGATQEILDATFGCQAPGFTHPFGTFSSSYAYVDRVCYRLPDHLRAEGGLQPHLDRNPYDPYLSGTKEGLTKWRPIQSFVSLVDQFGGASGGLKCVKGFHRETDEYFRTDDALDNKPSGGEFYRLHSTRNKLLHQRCQPVDAPAGSLVLWDNRLVHSTCDKFSSWDTREVIYVSYLPAAAPCNERYVKQQLDAIKSNQVPPGMEKRVGALNAEQSDRDWEECELSSLQRQLLRFESITKK